MQRNDLVQGMVETSSGAMLLAVSPSGIFSLTLRDENTAAGKKAPLPVSAAARKNSSLFREAEALLKAYFTGKPVDFRGLPLDLEDYSPFERKILTTLASSGRGELLSYRELGLRAGYPGSARAAGQVMNKNRIPVIIPCHRVIRSDGGLGGFACGLAWKRRLLALEGIFFPPAKAAGSKEELRPLLNV